MAKKVAAKKVSDDGAGLLAAPVKSKPRAAGSVNFDAVYGQSRAVRLLKEAMASGRVHHGWIFHGPVGVGKMTAARAFAAMLLNDGSEPIGAMLSTGTHPDLHVVTKELALVSREDNVRRSKQASIAKAVIEEFLLEPASRSRVVESKSIAHKVFIVDEAEMLNHISQNMLLKMIEEPPAGTIIILVTSDEHRLLTTIRSRCQRVGFETLRDDAMQMWLAASGIEVESTKRDWLLSMSGGSPGRFAEALTNDLYSWHTALDGPLRALLDGRVNEATALGSTMGKLIEERASEAVKDSPEASKDAANRAWSKRMLVFVADRTRRHLLASARDELGERAERLAGALDWIAAAERQIDGNVSYAASIDNMVSQISAGRVFIPER